MITCIKSAPARSSNQAAKIRISASPEAATLSDAIAPSREILEQLPTPQEYAELFTRYAREPSDTLRNEIAVTFLPRVERIAKRIAKKLGKIGANLHDDLVGAGSIALIESIRDYDNDNVRGTPFWPYAYKAVFGAMMEVLRDADPIGLSQRGDLKHLERSKSDLLNSGQLDFSDDKLAQASGITPTRLRFLARIERATKHAVSIDAAAVRLDASSSREDPAVICAQNDLANFLFSTLNEGDLGFAKTHFSCDRSLKEMRPLTNLNPNSVCKDKSRIVGALRHRLRSDPYLSEDVPRDVAKKVNVAEPSRRKSDPLAVALTYRASMEDQGVNAAGLAKNIGLSKVTVSKRLALLTLEPGVQAAISAGHITEENGYLISRFPRSQHAQIAACITSGQLNHYGLRELLQQYSIEVRSEIEMASVA